MAETNATGTRSENLIRKFLRCVYGIYSFFAVVFIFATALILIKEPNSKSFVNLVITLLMAYCCVMAFKSLKHSAQVTIKYAVLSFLLGFAATLIYRIIFVADAHWGTDFSNFLIFSLPAILTAYCSKLQKNN